MFISHKLNEVLDVGDRITVLRNGARVVTCDAAGATVRELARLMTGEERELSVEHRDTSANPPVLELRGVSARSSRGLTALHDVNLVVRTGRDPRRRRRVGQRPVRARRGAHRAAPVDAGEVWCPATG